MAIGFLPNPPTPTFTINGNDLTCFLTGYFFQWYLNGNAIPGATSFTYSITQNGNYYLSATNNYGCSSFSDTLYLTVTGLLSATEIARNISIYPNPTSSIMHIELQLPQQGEIQLKVWDVLGRSIEDWSYNNATGDFSTDIDLSTLAAGSYLLEILTDRGSLTQVIQKE